MWKRNLFFFVAICVSFSLGVCGAEHLLAAGPWGTSCETPTGCPGWQCTYPTTGGINATCTTCGAVDPTSGVMANCTIRYMRPMPSELFFSVLSTVEHMPRSEPGYSTYLCYL
jgi:hypothetical protein